MAFKSKKKKEELSEDEKHPLVAPLEEPANSAEEIANEIAKPEVEESKKISGSPLGKVRGKDLKNYINEKGI